MKLSITIRKWAVLVVGFTLTAMPSMAAPYTFIEGYTVLDEANSPGIGTNVALTAGLQQGMSVDQSRGIIYLSRGGAGNQYGRTNAPAGAIAAIVITNGFNGANYTDTGLISNDPGSPVLNFVQAPIFVDSAANRLFAIGQAISFEPTIYSAPAGTVGGAPAGGNPNAVNEAMTNVFTVPNDLTNHSGTIGRGGFGLGLTAKTVGGITTLYLGMGNHVEAWRNDAEVGAPQFPWRRVWATFRAPIQDTVASRLASSDTRLNDVELDDQGNCYFSLNTSKPARIWRVPANVENLVPNPLNLDFDDRALGGNNSGANMVVIPVLPRVPAPATTTNGTNNFFGPQCLTFFREGDRSGFFISVLAISSIIRQEERTVARMLIDGETTDANGFPIVSTTVVDAFGSGAPEEYQDATLKTMRLSSTTLGVTQPKTTSHTKDLLYVDVNSTTNPTILYVEALITDPAKGQTIPTAAVFKVAIPPLPPAFAITSTSRPDLNSFVLSWDSVPNHNYQVLASETIDSTTWNVVGSVTAVGVSTSFTNSGLSGIPMRFYRVISVPFAIPPMPAALAITSTSRPDLNSFVLSWDSVPTGKYQVVANETIDSPTWNLVGSVTATGNSTSFTNSGLNGIPTRFYRVIQIP